MKLQEIISGINPIEVIGSIDINITGVNIDSRRISNGHLFIAMRGTQVDGHQYISKAIESGASAIVCEETTDYVDNVTYIKVHSTEDIAGLMLTNPNTAGLFDPNIKESPPYSTICSVAWGTNVDYFLPCAITLKARHIQQSILLLTL